MIAAGKGLDEFLVYNKDVELERKNSDKNELLVSLRKLLRLLLELQ